VEEDKEDAIYSTIAELKAQIQAATLHNTAVVASQVNPLGLNVDLDMETVGGLGLKAITAPTGNTDRQEAKLCLTCASYCPTNRITLFDLRDSIMEVLAKKGMPA